MLHKDSKYFRLGLTLLTVIILSILFFITLENVGTVFNAVKKVLAVFSFVFYGIAFAYLMNPIQKLVEKGLKKLFGRTNMTERGLHKLCRTVSVIVALLTFIAVLYGLIAMVVPQLVETLTETFSQENLQNYYDKITTWLNNVVHGTPIEDWLQERDPVKAVQDWLTKEINIFSTLGNAVNEVYGVAKVLINMVIGLVAAVYLLMSKEKFIAQSKKLIVSVFRPKTADRLFEIGRLTNRSFGGFIVGKLIDSFIIGVLSYIGMLILGLPYPLLSSALVGIFNIIPFFGPLIGIVPAARAVHDRAKRAETKEKIVFRNYYMGSLVRLCDINRPLWERFLFVCLFTLVKTVKYASALPFKYYRSLLKMLPQVRAARKAFR